MNASCALQHFCDLHGPQVLLCTEERIYIQSVNDTEHEDLKTFYSQYIQSENPQLKAECKSCTLSSDGILVSTIDSRNHMQYISSPSTNNQELFKNLRNACKPTENDHPILFGDDENGYCLSLIFPCKDFHARGSQRLYSLCYLCYDKYHLLSLMNFISQCMRQAAYWLQYDANQTYENEGHIRIDTKLNGTPTGSYICRPPPCVPSQRMLSDIAHDSKLIYRIHALFVWILRTTNSAINESICDALPTEEQTTKQERRENEHLRKHRSRTIVDSTNPMTTDADNDDYDSLEYHFSSYGYAALRLFREFMQKLNNTNYLQHILYNWFIGNQLVIKYTNSSDSKDLIRAFASVFRLLLPDGCCHLMETTNQIVSCAANLILCDMDSIVTTNEWNGNNDPTSIIIKIIFDNIHEHIQVVELETLPSLKWNMSMPSYVKTMIEVLADPNLDAEAFEAIVIQQKIKYLNKAKVYFQLGRCQIAPTLSLSERQQMRILNINNPNDLFVIRFWQKGLSQLYKSQIRMLKQDDIQQQKIQKEVGGKQIYISNNRS